MDIIKFANSFQTSSVLELEGIKRLMERLGNPQNDLKFIHVAGTNGKGSVCAFLQSILTKSGKKCGKFSSPFMLFPEERIEIDGKMIPTEEFNRLLKEIGKIADGQSQFELWTAAAFCYFKQQKCDVVVLECGMGGIGDATNIIPAPEVGIITKIGLDHTEYLGDTIEKIAENKCGILKEGTKYTVTINQDVTSVVEKNAKGKFLIAEETEYPLSLKGGYQKQNAGIAVCVCRALGILEEDIKYGLSHAVHRGRFEVFDLNPEVIYDGAHNPDGVNVLADNIPEGKLDLICAFMNDKDVEGVFDVLKERKIHQRCKMYCTEVKNNPRAMSAEQLTKLAQKSGFNAECAKDIKSALEKRKNTTVVFGSLYLYKEFYEAIKAIG